MHPHCQARHHVVDGNWRLGCSIRGLPYSGARTAHLARRIWHPVSLRGDWVFVWTVELKPLFEEESEFDDAAHIYRQLWDGAS